ncbi:hypothetical protein NQ317_000356 [Molorchus minor]|uniref:Beta-amyloid precursor protein C-terminal domain-containing protein n=1 Tax=Molorchus minor TaxID=1323400 RepID=A0ABQ9JMM9_9CUCU|nr:hypothetical protein NQ317_000356 [Molorchus minor]
MQVNGYENPTYKYFEDVSGMRVERYIVHPFHKICIYGYNNQFEIDSQTSLGWIVMEKMEGSKDYST